MQMSKEDKLHVGREGEEGGREEQEEQQEEEAEKLSPLGCTLHAFFLRLKFWQTHTVYLENFLSGADSRVLCGSSRHGLVIVGKLRPRRTNCNFPREIPPSLVYICSSTI